MVSLGRGRPPQFLSPKVAGPTWKRIKKSSRFWYRFGMDFGAKMDPKSIQNHQKSDPKSCMVFGYVFWSIVGCFLQARTFDFDDSIMVFEGFCKFTWYRFWHQKPSKTRSQRHQKSIQNVIKHRIEKWSVFLSVLEPKWTPKWSKNGPHEVMERSGFGRLVETKRSFSEFDANFRAVSEKVCFSETGVSSRPNHQNPGPGPLGRALFSEGPFAKKKPKSAMGPLSGPVAQKVTFT